MFCTRRLLVLGLVTALLLAPISIGSAAGGENSKPEPSWQAGFARTVITPEEFIWMSGYGGRDKPAEGKIHDLYARAAALEDPAGHTAVFVALDLVTVPAKMARVVSERIKKQHGIARADLMLTCSHTHCGPALDDRLSHMLAMNEDDWQQVKAYQKRLNDKVVALIGQALKDRKPARLAAGTGTCGFANNRRPPIGEGPTDHDVPVLRVTAPDGTLRGVIFGYACHNTTLSFYKWCGDYAGFAQLTLEDRHPGATALFFTGCGGDQNPLPRRKLELAEKYGRLLAHSVEEELSSEMKPVQGTLRTAFRTIPLAFDRLPPEEHWKKRLESSNRFERQRAAFLLEKIERNGSLAKTYPYPIQVWQFGEAATLVALGGEVVVDYSLRLKKELAGETIWVAGYANDVMAYIPSERVLSEGGYEGGGAMRYYQMPSEWKPGLEEQIVGTVKSMAGKLQRAPEHGK